MSINILMEQACIHKAVYWGNPVKNGHGGFTYSTAIEIPCRWVERMQMVKNETANTQLLSRAYLYTLQPLTLEGYIFKGTLSQIATAGLLNPRVVQGSLMVKLDELIPALFDEEVPVYKYYLAEYLNY